MSTNNKKVDSTIKQFLEFTEYFKDESDRATVILSAAK